MLTGDKAARTLLISSVRELIGATHALTVAAMDVPTLPSSPAAIETLLQKCAQYTTRILQITGGAKGDDIHAIAFAALTSAEQVPF